MVRVDLMSCDLFGFDALLSFSDAALLLCPDLQESLISFEEAWDSLMSTSDFTEQMVHVLPISVPIVFCTRFESVQNLA